MSMNSLTRLFLPLMASASILTCAADTNIPKNSANMDAKRDVAAKSGFLTDTNRAFPMLFIVGDSTVHNPGKGERGWGDVIGKSFDTNKIRVENHALGGRSSRTFITQGYWDMILAAAKPGDFVLIQMGHNDGGALNEEPPGSKYPLRARGTIRGLGEETQKIDNVITKQHETVHTYGWYLRKYVADARAKGMTPVLCTPIPHCPKEQVKAGEVEKSDYVRLSAAVADAEKVPLVNLNRLTMNEYAKFTPAEVKAKYFTPADGTHTSPAGAELNAQSVINGLKQLPDCPLASYLKSDASK
jgi:rhamnogalacturonan acetylesterase